MGLGSWEVQPQLSRIIMEPKSVVLISNDSEELNRAMILTLARAVHVTGIAAWFTYLRNNNNSNHETQLNFTWLSLFFNIVNGRRLLRIFFIFTGSVPHECPSSRQIGLIRCMAR